MAHPHIDSVRDEVFAHKPKCMNHPAPPGVVIARRGRCARPASVWLVAPTGEAIMRVCEPCGVRILAEYDANQEAVGGKWYSVALKIASGAK